MASISEYDQCLYEDCVTNRTVGTQLPVLMCVYVLAYVLPGQNKMSENMDESKVEGNDVAIATVLKSVFSLFFSCFIPSRSYSNAHTYTQLDT